MFWTAASANGSIWRSGMDGSNPSKIVVGLNNPVGITIDFDDARLYWVTGGDDRVHSCDMEGQVMKTVVQLPWGAGPIGIGLLGGRIYWTLGFGQKLQSINKSGQDIQSVPLRGDIMFNLAAVPRMDLPRNRTNDCDKAHCSKVCVLTPSSYRCLS